jgi:hypothetical protein
MTWNPDVISSRKLRKDRDRRLDLHESMRTTIKTMWFAQLVEIIAEARPESHMGRPRTHAPQTVALMMTLSLMMRSQAEAEQYLKYGNNWNSFRRLLAATSPDEPLLGPGAPAPSRFMVRHAKERLGLAEGEKLESIMKSGALLYAEEMGIGINHGTMLMPSVNAGMFGDGVVIRPMSRYKRGDMGWNERTGQWQQRRFDPDATYSMDGMKRRVYGNEFVQMSARTGAANEVITFAIHPLRKGGTETEASIALGMARDVKAELPGMAMLHYDKALRGRTVEELWDLQLLPMIGVYDKTGLATEEVPLGTKTIDGVKVSLFAFRGGVSIKALDGSFISLTATKLSYIPNAGDTYRVYCDYVVPDGANCDTRLWGGKVRQRMNSPEKAGFVYGEHVRAHAPGSPEWKNLYGNRSLAESVNSWVKNKLGPGARARSLNQTHQWIDLMIMLMLRNDQSLTLYRRRTQLARTASPPAA